MTYCYAAAALELSIQKNERQHESKAKSKVCIHWVNNTATVSYI